MIWNDDQLHLTSFHCVYSHSFGETLLNNQQFISFLISPFFLADEQSVQVECSTRLKLEAKKAKNRYKQGFQDKQGFQKDCN